MKKFDGVQLRGLFKQANDIHLYPVLGLIGDTAFNQRWPVLPQGNATQSWQNLV